MLDDLPALDLDLEDLEDLLDSLPDDFFEDRLDSFDEFDDLLDDLADLLLEPLDFSAEVPRGVAPEDELPVALPDD